MKGIAPARITLRPVTAVAPPKSKNYTLSQWLMRWMERSVEPNLARTTVHAYRNIINNHLSPALGQVRLSRLSPALLEEYYRWLAAERNLSANTIRKHHILLHTSLQSACRLGVLGSNPADLAVPPRFEMYSPHYYTPEQLSALLCAVADHPLEIPVRLACALGLRRGEIVGLRWGDVDLQQGLLHISRSRTTVGNHVIEKAPKNPTSCRTLSIAPMKELTSLLRRTQATRLRSALPCSADDLLVLDARGQPWNPNLLTAAFSDFISQHDLPPITLHGLRHTFASIASNARVPMYQISRAMGHSNPTTTQRIYTHLFEPTHNEVFEAVAAVIGE